MHFTMPYGISCDISGLCPQRLMSRVPARSGILITPDLVGVAQRQFFGNSIYWYKVNVHKIHKYCHRQGSLIQQTHADSLCPLQPAKVKPNHSQLVSYSPLSRLNSKSLKRRHQLEYVLVQLRLLAQTRTLFPYIQPVRTQRCVLILQYSIRCFICRPSDSTGSLDVGVEHWTFATFALAVNRSNHLAIELIDILLGLLHTTRRDQNSDI